MATYRMIARILMLAAAAVVLQSCGGDPGDRAYRKGLEALEDGKYVRAKTELEKAVESRPGHAEDNARSLSYLGVAHWHLGERDQAKDAFERSRILDPDLAAPVYNLAMLAEQNGDIAVTELYLREASLLPDPDPRAPEYLGHLYLRNGRWTEARRALLDAHERVPASPRVLTALATVALEIDGAEDAVLYLMQALEADPDYLPALHNLAHIYATRLGDQEQARAYYQQYVDAAPPGERKKQALAFLSGAASGTGAEADPDTGTERVEAGAPRYDQLLETAAKKVETGAVEEALNLCLMVAARAHREGDEATREKALRTAIDLCFDQGRAHYAWGRYLLERKQNTEARRAFSQATALAPDLKEAHLALASLAVQEDDPKVALEALDALRRIDPRDPDPYWMTAEFLDRGSEPLRAATAYEEFRRLFPDDPRAVKAGDRLRVLKPASPPDPDAPSGSGSATSMRVQPGRSGGTAPREPTVSSSAGQAFRRGVMYHRQKDWDRALYFYGRTVELDPSMVQAYYNLGLVHGALGASDEARKAYETALRLDPGMVKARFNLALLQVERKQDVEAEQELKALLAVAPEYAQAHNLLGILYSRHASRQGLAKQHFQRFVELAPTDPAAAAARTWIAQH